MLHGELAVHLVFLRCDQDLRIAGLDDAHVLTGDRDVRQTIAHEIAATDSDQVGEISGFIAWRKHRSDVLDQRSGCSLQRSTQAVHWKVGNPSNSACSTLLLDFA